MLDYESRFGEAVIEDFLDSYLRGETPIPCVRCNQRIKFRDLLATARELGADAMATGHYVRRLEGAAGPELHRGAEPGRDQSYFLFATTAEQLAFLRFPLGDLGKAETRALARRFGPAWVDRPLWAIVEVIRGTPFLVQMFLLYYGGPFIGLDLEPTTAGLLGLTIYGAAYFSEILRGGLIAVPKGHVEAALCVGLNRMQIIRRILLPEMTLLVLPASVNMFIVLLKETAVLSIITVPELTMAVTGFGSANFAFTQAALVLALSRGAAPREALAWGSAAGAAAVTASGTAHPPRALVETLYQQALSIEAHSR